VQYFWASDPRAKEFGPIRKKYLYLMTWGKVPPLDDVVKHEYRGYEYLVQQM
jgi:hypothetical protein